MKHLSKFMAFMFLVTSCISRAMVNDEKLYIANFSDITLKAEVTFKNVAYQKQLFIIASGEVIYVDQPSADVVNTVTARNPDSGQIAKLSRQKAKSNFFVITLDNDGNPQVKVAESSQKDEMIFKGREGVSQKEKAKSKVNAALTGDTLYIGNLSNSPVSVEITFKSGEAKKVVVVPANKSKMVACSLSQIKTITAKNAQSKMINIKVPFKDLSSEVIVIKHTINVSAASDEERAIVNNTLE